MRAGRERLPGGTRKGECPGGAQNARDRARRLAAVGLCEFALDVHLRSVVFKGNSLDHSIEKK
jgi:hypothetical protein